MKGAFRSLLRVVVIAYPIHVVYGQFTYTIDEGEASIKGYTGPVIEVVIPGMIEGVSVTSIGKSAFYGCTSLTRVTNPDRVTYFGDGVSPKQPNPKTARQHSTRTRPDQL